MMAGMGLILYLLPKMSPDPNSEEMKQARLELAKEGGMAAGILKSIGMLPAQPESSPKEGQGRERKNSK
jgi:hypothetical protein